MNILFKFHQEILNNAIKYFRNSIIKIQLNAYQSFNFHFFYPPF